VAASAAEVSAFAFFAPSSFADSAFRLGAAVVFLSAFLAPSLGFAGALSFFSPAAAAGFDFFVVAADVAFLAIVLTFSPMAAVEDFVASRGDRRVGADGAFLGGIAFYGTRKRGRELTDEWSEGLFVWEEAKRLLGRRQNEGEAYYSVTDHYYVCGRKKYNADTRAADPKRQQNKFLAKSKRRFSARFA
jgi:hypothetical protein